MVDEFLNSFYKETTEALVSRGYSLEKARRMVRDSDLAKEMKHPYERWAYTHDMEVSDWADWIEEENGFKEPPIPIWKKNLNIA